MCVCVFFCVVDALFLHMCGLISVDCGNGQYCRELSFKEPNFLFNKKQTKNGLISVDCGNSP